MTTRGIDDLITGMGSDEALAADLGAASSVDEFIATAAAHGYSISAEELTGSIDTIPLSDNQLELVGGGYATGKRCIKCGRFEGDHNPSCPGDFR